MRRSIRTAVALAAAVVPLTLMGTSANASQTYTGLIVGNGTISPGLTNTPTSQSVGFRADLILGVGTAGATIVATECQFSGGSSAPETLAGGAGSGILGSCNGVNVSGNITYNRQANVVTLGGSLSINGAAHTTGPNVCVFVPTSGVPVTSYGLLCTGLIVDA